MEECIKENKEFNEEAVTSFKKCGSSKWAKWVHSCILESGHAPTRSLQEVRDWYILYMLKKHNSAKDDKERAALLLTT